MRVHEATTEKKGLEKPYERTPRGARTRRDPPPKHNFRVELKELITIPNIAARLKVPTKTDKKMRPIRTLGVNSIRRMTTIYETV